jgi:hypothetical protein
MTSHTSISNSPSRLLALPIELQLAIYEEALILPYEVAIFRSCVVFFQPEKFAARGYGPLTTRLVALTQTCRYLRKVTSPIFYQRNTFRVECLDPSHPIRHVEAWLAGLDQERRLWVHSLYFFNRSDADFWTDFLLRSTILESSIVRELKGKVQKPDLEHNETGERRGRHSVNFPPELYGGYEVTFCREIDCGVGHEDLSDAWQEFFSAGDAAAAVE